MKPITLSGEGKAERFNQETPMKKQAYASVWDALEDTAERRPICAYARSS